MQRRKFIAFLALALAGWGGSRASDGSSKAPLRIGLTPVFLDDQAGFLDQWRSYLEAKLQRPIAYFQRGSYREIVDLLRQGKCDIAWLCSFPYVRNRHYLRLLAVPEFERRPLYRSYLIVPAGDQSTRSILDLRDRIFAFSDPDSNSGYLYPNFRLLSQRERPDAFFRKTFFTWNHRKVVEAVAAGVADGGAVDGYIWETLARFHPELTAATRVAEISPEFGFPPFVARATLPERTVHEVRGVLMSMARDTKGQKMLGALNLTGFTSGEDRLFAGVRRMAKIVGDDRRAAAP